MTLFVSQTGRDDSWLRLAHSPDDHATAIARDEMSFDLQRGAGRYLRVRIHTSGKPVVLGEVRVWGWPLHGHGTQEETHEP